MNKARRSLGDFTDQVFVVAHREDTSQLEETLRGQRFRVDVVRGPYTDEQVSWTAAMKCLVNHANVWRRVAAGSDEWAIVVEADFVPVVQLRDRVAPLPYVAAPHVGFAWLYSAGSTLYGFCSHGFPHGHGNTMVAYLVSRRVAAMLLDFFDREVSRNPDGKYSLWDTYLGVFLRRERGIVNYIPARPLGEHGGTPQREHSAHGVRSWHQADILGGRLAFLPQYAGASRIKFCLYRLRAYGRGWARLVLLRFYDPRFINRDTARGRTAMALFSVSRLFPVIRAS